MNTNSTPINDHNKRLLLPLLLLPLWLVVYTNLHPISDFITDRIFGLEANTHFTESVRFFIYEVPKVMLLLVLVIFGVGIIRSYFSAEKTKKFLEGKSLFTGNIMAALLGIVTPFCSCSAIPLFLGFVEAGIPIGVTFSFLIAAPLVNEVALVLLIGLFGWKIAVVYVLTGLLIAIFSGWLIGKLKLEGYVEAWVYQVKTGDAAEDDHPTPFSERLKAGFDTVREVVGKVWIYVVIGIAIGAGAHGYVPEDYMSALLGQEHWYGVPLAIILGVPMYSNAAGIIPIVGVLTEKGVSIGTALAFMMSVIALSLPEMIILKKVLKWQLIAIFAGIVATGILIVGFLLNMTL